MNSPRQKHHVTPTEKLPRKRVDITLIAFWIGLISGTCSICVYVSGIESFPQLFSLLSGIQPTATIQPPEPTLQPLISGGSELPITSFSETFQVGFNFSLNKIIPLSESVDSSSPTGYIDLVISNCSANPNPR